MKTRETAVFWRGFSNRIGSITQIRLDEQIIDNRKKKIRFNTVTLKDKNRYFMLIGKKPGKIKASVTYVSQ